MKQYSRDFTLRPYSVSDRQAVVRLWVNALGYTGPHQDPEMAIDLKCAQDDGLFIVADIAGQVKGTVMGGFDGHRGWIYSLAVDENFRHHGIGRALLDNVIEKLRALGCPKVNLQVLPGNTAVDFYKKAGFNVEERISMGLKLK